MLVIRHRPWFVVLAVVLLNVFTQPLATLAVTIWPAWFYGIEIVVLVVESVGLWLLLEIHYPKGLELSLLANGLTTALAVLWMWHGQPQMDMRYFSPMLHDTGKQLLQTYPDPAVAVRHCSTALMAGCIHGVVMTYVDEHFDERTPDGWFQWCYEEIGVSTDECIHGIGHSFAMHLTGNINEVLAPCSQLFTSHDQAACASGIFMEHSLMGMGSSCSLVSVQWKPVCYASAGSYRQYLPGQETVQATERWCEDHAGDYVADCLYGLQQRMNLAVDN